MDIWNNPLKERSSKRPKQRSGIVPPTLRVAPGKENLCPSDWRTLNAPLGESRSPLPEGFPRAALQDITDFLSPLNVPTEGELQGQVASGKKGVRRKKARQEISMETKSEFRKPNVSWEGLTQCSSVVGTMQPTQIQTQKAKSDGSAEEKAQAKDGNTESTIGTDIMTSSTLEDTSLHITREHKRPRQSTRVTQYNAKSSVLKLR